MRRRPLSSERRNANDKAERRAEREADLAAKQTALPEKRYGVIYADPEWRFEVYSRDTGMQTMEPEPQKRVPSRPNRPGKYGSHWRVRGSRQRGPEPLRAPGRG
jgi:hypothetical protein